MAEIDFDPYALGEVRIGELDLAVLARVYKFLMYFTEGRTENQERNEENPEESRIIDDAMLYMLGDGPNKNERDVAMLMMMEESFAAEHRKAVAQKVLEKYKINSDESGQ